MLWPYCNIAIPARVVHVYVQYLPGIATLVQYLLRVGMACTYSSTPCTKCVFNIAICHIILQLFCNIAIPFLQYCNTCTRVVLEYWYCNTGTRVHTCTGTDVPIPRQHAEKAKLQQSIEYTSCVLVHSTAFNIASRSWFRMVRMPYYCNTSTRVLEWYTCTRVVHVYQDC